MRGNVPLARTSENALKVVELARRPDVPVYAGCPGPMVRKLKTAEHAHGPTGLDGASLPPPVTPLQREHAVDYLVRAIMTAPENELTVCTLGPMTNLAMAMVMEPRVISRLREVVLMGGGFFQGGNATPAAEFNIFVDPDRLPDTRSGIERMMAGDRMAGKERARLRRELRANFGRSQAARMEAAAGRNG